MNIKCTAGALTSRCSCIWYLCFHSAMVEKLGTFQTASKAPSHQSQLPTQKQPVDYPKHWPSSSKTTIRHNTGSPAMVLWWCFIHPRKAPLTAEREPWLFSRRPRSQACAYPCFGPQALRCEPFGNLKGSWSGWSDLKSSGLLDSFLRLCCQVVRA